MYNTSASKPRIFTKKCSFQCFNDLDKLFSRVYEHCNVFPFFTSYTYLLARQAVWQRILHRKIVHWFHRHHPCLQFLALKSNELTNWSTIKLYENLTTAVANDFGSCFELFFTVELTKIPVGHRVLQHEHFLVEICNVLYIFLFKF